ncbi:MAG: hypothetical protein E7509_07675 [Ruminococcus sp.]|nr:hypothetical protein [Ruminococcus sp.]
MRRLSLSDLRELFFTGYSKEEYETLEVGLIRGAKKSFNLQRSFIIIFSLIVAGFEFISEMYWHLLFSSSYHPANIPHMAGGGIILLFSLLSMKFKTTCIITSIMYLGSTVYLLFEDGETVLAVLCLIGAALYVRLFIVHSHLRHIKKRGDVDSFGAMVAIAAQADNVDASLRMMFETHNQSDEMSNEERLRFEKVFGVDVGGDENLKKVDVAEILKTDVSDINVGFSMPSIDIDVADIKEKVDDLTDKLAGVEKEEKSRLEWYTYMPKDE